MHNTEYLNRIWHYKNIYRMHQVYMCIYIYIYQHHVSPPTNHPQACSSTIDPSLWSSAPRFPIDWGRPRRHHLPSTYHRHWPIYAPWWSCDGRRPANIRGVNDGRMTGTGWRDEGPLLSIIQQHCRHNNNLSILQLRHCISRLGLNSIFDHDGLKKPLDIAVQTAHGFGVGRKDRKKNYLHSMD